MTSVILGDTRDAVEELASFARRRADERAYVTHHLADVASGGGTITVRLANPTSDTNIDVERIIISSQFAGQYRVYDVFSSAPTGGSTNDIDNLLMDSGNGSNDDGQMTAETGVTFTADGAHYAEVLASGGAGGMTSGGHGEAPDPIIQPGREIVVELQNDATETKPGSIGIVYTETEQPV